MKNAIKVLLIKLCIISPFCLAESALIFCEQEVENCHTESAIQLSKKFPQHFEFADSKLTIRATNLQKTLLLNQPLTYESENEKNISLDRYFPELNWLVIREVYDGGESIGYQIIDLNHQLNTTELASYPILSNDNTHFINYGIDLEAGFTLNGIVIYKIGDQGEIKEVFRQDDSWGVLSAAWISPTQIALTSSDYCDQDQRDNLCDQKMKLDLKNNMWHLSPIK